MPEIPQPNFLERLSAAYKALRHVPDSDTKSIPFPQNSGSSIVSTYSSWDAWNTARMKSLTQTASDPSGSSLIMSGVRWLGNRLPEAVLTVQEPTDDDEFQAITDHPILPLFKRANPFMSASTLWKAFALSWIIKGDVYFLKFRNDRQKVSELWYEPHTNVRPRWVGDGRGSYIYGENDDPNAFITYYEVDRYGRKYRVEVSDVIHFRDGIDPSDPRCGLSGIATILREILSDSQVADYSGKLLANGGVPPYVLSIDNKAGTLEQDDIEAIKSSLMRQTSGNHAGEPLVITDAKVEKLGFSPEELDLRVSRYLSEERFAAVTGIPSEVLQLGAGKEHSIYNNVSEARQDAAQGYLAPLWWHIAEELTVQLLPDFDENQKHFIEHDISEVQALQEDEDAKHTRVGLDYQNGIITREEARMALDMPTDAEKDNVYFVRSGSSTVTLEQEEESRKPKPPVQLPIIKPQPALPDGTENDNSAKSVLHIAKREQQEKAREHWERHAPARVKGLISARVK